MTFADCKNRVGSYFDIEPKPNNFLSSYPLQLIRFNGEYLVFYIKAGTQQLRIDLNEETFYKYSINER